MQQLDESKQIIQKMNEQVQDSSQVISDKKQKILELNKQVQNLM